MDFLHGSRSSSNLNKNATIRLVPTAVMFLVGISPVGPTQALTLCNNESDDAKFGDATPANDIATSLQLIRKAASGITNPGGSCPVVVVNVFNSTNHTATLSSITGTVTGKKFALRKHLYGTIVVKKNSDDSVVSTSKYSFDAWGNFTDITPTGELEGLVLKVEGKYVIPAVAADIVGTVDGSNIRTGMKLAHECYSKFRFNPKIILTPKYSTLSTVFAEGRALADAFRGRWLHDCESGDSVTDVIGYRTTSTIGWNTSHSRTDLLYPWWKVSNAFEAVALGSDDVTIAWPYSAVYAGCMVKNDLDPERTYGSSPSNMEISGVVEPEVAITCSFNNTSSENQLLNANGIVTYTNMDGYRTWGNRSACFPSISGLPSFIKVQRVDDILSESIEIGFAKSNDKNITKAFIKVMTEQGNNLLSPLVQAGILYPGSEVKYVPEDNTQATLQEGNIKFRRSWLTPPPAELIEVYSELNLNLFKSLNSN